MKVLKTASAALTAILILGTAAATALALPDAHLLAGESYPLRTEIADNEKTTVELQSTGGGKLTGKGLGLSGSLAELSALGKAELVILNVQNTGKETCHSTGDKAGEVLVKDEFHIVFISLVPLEVGVLHTGNEVTIECGKTTIKVRGSLLGTLNGANAADITELGSRVEGSKGKNTLTEYFDDEGKKVKGILQADFETGLKQAMVVAGEEVTIKALEGKMGTILGE